MRIGLVRTGANVLILVGLAFDADGTQTAVTTDTGRWLVGYNGENRPVRWTRQADGTVLEMAYDGRGRRVRSGGETFVYDGYLNVGATVWDPTEPVATRPLVWLSGGSPAYYFHDGNKNVSDVVAGSAFARYSYAPFGRSEAEGELTDENPYRFSSEVHDGILDLTCYNYRHYDLIVGRWMARDKLELSPGQSFYLFVQNNMLNSYDYVGMFGNPVSDGTRYYPSQPSSGSIPRVRPPSGTACPIKCPKGAKVVTDETGTRYRTGRDNGKEKTKNGCGAEGGTSVPNSYMGIVDFTGCCNDHDACYETCGGNKGTCDTNLGSCMSDKCNQCLGEYPDHLGRCLVMASVYEWAVSKWGDKPYESAQDKGCEWEPCELEK